VKFCEFFNPKKKLHEFLILPAGPDTASPLFRFANVDNGGDSANYYDVFRATEQDSSFFVRCGTGCAMFPSSDSKKRNQLAYTSYLNGQGHREIPAGEINSFTKVSISNGTDSGLFLSIASMELHKHYTEYYK